MHYCNIIALQLFLLSSSTLFCSDAQAVATPLIQQQRVERTGPSWLRCCAVTTVFLTLAGGMATLGILGCSDNPTPAPTHAPTHLYESRLEIVVSPLCSDACPTPIDQQGFCIPTISEKSIIKKQLQDICPHSTQIQLITCTKCAPYPPCTDVNATLQELTTTCSPNSTHPLKAPTVVDMKTVRDRFCKAQMQRAKLRKPADLRS